MRVELRRVFINNRRDKESFSIRVEIRRVFINKNRDKESINQ